MTSIRQISTRRPVAAGFTILEVVVASAVLLFGIMTALVVIQSGLQAVDSARNYSTAAQLMQNEMERLRLNSWSQLEALQSSAATAVAVTETARSNGASFVCTRSIRDLKTDMKEIKLVASWRGYDGRPQTAELVTRYGKTGLYDYLYTSH